MNADVVANGQFISHPSLHSTARNKGLLATTASTPDSIFGNGHSLTVGGLDIDSLTLDGVRLIDEGGTIANFNHVVFQNNDPTGTQFTIHHPGASNAFAFEGLKFLSTPSSGYYINATDNRADSNVLTINLISSVPRYGSARTIMSGGAVVNWGINGLPTLVSVSPLLVRRGEKTTITLNGSNFIDSVTTVAFGGGIIIDSLRFNSTSQIGAHVTVMDSAGIGTRTVSVTNPPPGGGTAALQNALTVGYPRPTISRIIPDSANRIQTLSFVIRGRKFSQALTSVDFGGNIAINSKSVNSDTQVTIGATIGANAAAGSRNVIVTNISPGGGSDTLKNGLLIMNPAPSLSSVAPPAATRGQSASVLLTGLYFFAGTTGVSFGDSIAVNSVTVNDSAHLTANISIAPGAVPGLRSVTVTNSPPGGGSTTLSNAFTVQDSAITLQIGEGNGWNMVSVPAVVSDFHKNSLYPGAVSKAFSFQGAYVVQDLLENGVGYWIKFSSATTDSFAGARIEVDSISVSTGWNMIGALSHPVPRTNVFPAGTAMVSRFFGYTNSYHVSDTLFPGRAYWIKVSQDGRLVLKVNSVVAVPGISEKGSAARCTSGAAASTPIEKGLGRLTVRDALGKAQTLYFTQTRPKSLDENRYVLPPLPPDGVFDVRYATQTSLEITDRVRQRDVAILISSAAYPVTIEWNSRLRVDQGALMIDGNSIPLRSQGQIQILNSESQVRLRLSPASSKELPRAFLLHQNFPNPFNPTTTIRYDLPQDAHVSVKIYNSLGQVVKTLINGDEGGGFKSVDWNSTNNAGNDVASGVYFYRLEARSTAHPGQTFAQVKKMLITR